MIADRPGFPISSNSRNDQDTARTANPATHRLKCWPEFFQAILDGRKMHDLRRCDDRHFSIGDRLELREFDPKTERYSGRELTVEVTYVTSAEVPCALSAQALDRNFCILSIKKL